MLSVLRTCGDSRRRSPRHNQLAITETQHLAGVRHRVLGADGLQLALWYAAQAHQLFAPSHLAVGGAVLVSQHHAVPRHCVLGADALQLVLRYTAQAQQLTPLRRRIQVALR